MKIERKEIESLVREKLLVVLQGQKTETAQKSSDSVLDFVNEQVVSANKNKNVIFVSPNAIITPSARDTAEHLGILFQVSVGSSSHTIDTIGPQSVAIGADHGGFTLKEEIKESLKTSGYQVVDVGTHSTESVDYPDFAYAVATLVAKGQCKRGIVIDGAGIGSAIVANKVKGIRAANCRDLSEIKNSREHNDTNILTLGARLIASALAIELVRVWLETPFAGGRHKQRVDKIIRFESNPG